LKKIFSKSYKNFNLVEVYHTSLSSPKINKNGNIFNITFIKFTLTLKNKQVFNDLRRILRLIKRKFWLDPLLNFLQDPRFIIKQWNSEWKRKQFEGDVH